MQTQFLNQKNWQLLQHRMTQQAVTLTYSDNAKSLKSVIKRISMKDALREGEALLYFS